MKLYFLKLYGGEEGPHGEAQIAQMFADGRVNRDTPCKPADGTTWKTVDDYLPMLKYGTQVPPPTPAPAPVLNQPLSSISQRVSVVDFDIPFGSMLRIMFKWMAAGFIVFCCFIPAIILVGVIVMSLFAAFLGGAMSSLHH